MAPPHNRTRQPSPAPRTAGCRPQDGGGQAGNECRHHPPADSARPRAARRLPGAEPVSALPPSPWLTAAEAAIYLKRGKRFVLREIHNGKLQRRASAGVAKFSPVGIGATGHVEDMAAPVSAPEARLKNETPADRGGRHWGNDDDGKRPEHVTTDRSHGTCPRRSAGPSNRAPGWKISAATT